MIEKLRNIAIIAHVDHGKTTLVDKLLEQSGTLGERADTLERAMDSNELEQERGITILSKNTAVKWHDYRINIVDTPGHADFGGEVERVMSMVDSVLLLVDAVEGPMPQTRFVTSKALAQGLKPIVVVNKIDRPGSRPDWVIDQTFDLFDRLGASDEQMDFEVVYASALEGYAMLDHAVQGSDMQPLFQTIVDKVAPPDVDMDGPLQIQVSALDYDSYVGLIGVGRIQRGKLKTNQKVTIVNPQGNTRKGKILQVLGYMGLERTEIPEASAGDIIAFSGMAGLKISDTICDNDAVDALPALSIDEPTVAMNFLVNTSPFAGQVGKFITSRQILERLQKELEHNVALRVVQSEDADRFKVSGRGELHLSVLIETMRREGFELAVSRPEVIYREINGVIHEPFELVTIDVREQHQGSIMERMGKRAADMIDMVPDGNGRVRLDFRIPSKGLIGFRNEFMTATQGSGLINSIFEKYDVQKLKKITSRINGVLISNGQGKALGYALFNLQERGKLLLGHAEEVYEGMIVGIHNRANDLTVNPLKAKQLTNIRAAGTDENLILTKPIIFTLEQALEFIEDDELVEVTPSSIRVRKKYLTENERKRMSRGSTAGQ